MSGVPAEFLALRTVMCPSCFHTELAACGGDWLCPVCGLPHTEGNTMSRESVEVVSHGCIRDDGGGVCDCPDMRECGNAYPICGYGNCHLAENSCPACQGII